MRFTMPVRRPVLRALLAATAFAVPALSALAQARTSAAAVGAPAGAPAARRLIGAGSIGIALLVPPANGIYQRTGEALVEGAAAAHARDGAGVAIEVIPIDDDPIELRGLYDELHGRGFSMVIGPLTRRAVSLIADVGPPPVFTLALNQPERGALPPNMLSMGLSIESEAQQAAAVAWEEAVAASRRPRAAVIQDATPLGRRSASAFAERWLSLGGDAYEAIEVETATAGRVRSQLESVRADVYFVAGPPSLAQAVRVAVGTDAVVYGTSRLNSGIASPADTVPAGSASERYLIAAPELDGVRFVDMPWRVQPDHRAVMAYPRPAGMHAELQKIYALGIDAYRVARLLLSRAPAIQLDGVTGRLRLSPDGSLVEREGVIAEYRDGVIVALASP